MKKIAMFTMGTRGDVQPYIFLGKGLIDKGYEVTIGSHPCWRNLVESNNINFAPIGPDIDIEKEAAIIRGKNSNPTVSMMKTMNFVFRIIQNSSQEIYDACIGKDLVVVSHAHMGAAEAEALGIPTVDVTLQKEMIPQALKPQSLADKLFWGLINRQMARPYNKIRKKYDLKPVKSVGMMASKEVNLIPISKHVLERNPYWEDKNVLTGYWYFDTPYTPDSELEEFIKEGDAPVILALGAMSFEDKPEVEKLDMFVRAFEKTGCRAIIQGFNSTLKDYKLPKEMIACGSIPHSWLFRNGKFVIHHSGFGTSAATLIYGIPSIPVPHVLDQMGFANQLNDLKVSTAPIQAKDLSEKVIVDAIEEMNRSFEEKKKNAIEISEKIKNEKGLETAIELIEKVINKYE